MEIETQEVETQTDIDALSFEDAFGQLEQTVASLDDGNLTLERALLLFEDGMRLVQRCNTMLDRAELRIRQLVPREDGLAFADLQV